MHQTLVRLALAVAIVTAAPAPAQCFAIPDDQPAQGRCNWIPFGRASGDPLTGNQRYQTVLTKADLGSTLGSISGLQFAPCGVSGATTAGVYHIASITIVMDHRAPGPLSKTFASNRSAAAVTVLDARDYDWPVTGDQWNEIGLQRAFAYDPAKGDLLIDITVVGTGLASGNLTTGMHRGDRNQRVFDYGWSGVPPATARFADTFALKARACMSVAHTAAFGVGCPAAKPLTLGYSSLPRLGRSLFVDVSKAPPGSVAIILSASNAPPLPFNMASYNMPGCRLYVAAGTTVNVPVTAGVATLAVPIPNDPRLLGAVFFHQASALDSTANPAGVSMSNFGRAAVGI